MFTFQSGEEYCNNSQLIHHTTRQSLTGFCPRFSYEISLCSYLHTIYIKFYLTTYKILIKFDAFNCFDSFIKKLQKALDCINHVTYTCVYNQLFSFYSPAKCQNLAFSVTFQESLFIHFIFGIPIVH